MERHPRTGGVLALVVVNFDDRRLRRPLGTGQPGQRDQFSDHFGDHRAEPVRGGRSRISPGRLIGRNHKEADHFARNLIDEFERLRRALEIRGKYHANSSSRDRILSPHRRPSTAFLQPAELHPATKHRPGRATTFGQSWSVRPRHRYHAAVRCQLRCEQRLRERSRQSPTAAHARGPEYLRTWSRARTFHRPTGQRKGQLTLPLRLSGRTFARSELIPALVESYSST